jgi:hypothetical protein
LSAIRPSSGFDALLILPLRHGEFNLFRWRRGNCPENRPGGYFHARSPWAFVRRATATRSGGISRDFRCRETRRAHGCVRSRNLSRTLGSTGPIGPCWCLRRGANRPVRCASGGAVGQSIRGSFADREWPHGWKGSGLPHGVVFSR